MTDSSSSSYFVTVTQWCTTNTLGKSINSFLQMPKNYDNRNLPVTTKMFSIYTIMISLDYGPFIKEVIIRVIRKNQTFCNFNFDYKYD